MARAEISPGDHVTYVDDDGEPHDAVVIDVFDRPDAHGPYANLVYNPGRPDFYANTKSGLEDDTSVGFRADEDGPRYWELGWSTG